MGPSEGKEEARPGLQGRLRIQNAPRGSFQDAISAVIETLEKVRKPMEW